MKNQVVWAKRNLSSLVTQGTMGVIKDEQGESYTVEFYWGLDPNDPESLEDPSIGTSTTTMVVEAADLKFGRAMDIIEDDEADDERFYHDG